MNYPPSSWLLAVLSLTLHPFHNVAAQTPISSAAAPIPSGDPIIGSYMIIPKDPKAGGNDAFNQSLADTFKDDVYTEQIDVLGYIFWRLPLTAAQRTQYQQNPLVGHVVSLFKRKDEDVRIELTRILIPRSSRSPKTLLPRSMPPMDRTLRRGCHCRTDSRLQI